MTQAPGKTPLSQERHFDIYNNNQPPLSPLPMMENENKKYFNFAIPGPQHWSTSHALSSHKTSFLYFWS